MNNYLYYYICIVSARKTDSKSLYHNKNKCVLLTFEERAICF